MNTLSRQFLLCLSIISLSLIAPAPGNGQPSAKSDYVGDPLPEGAVLRLGTARLRHPGSIEYLRFTDDCRSLIAVGYRSMPTIWDVETGERIKTDAAQFELVDQTTGKSTLARILPALETFVAFGREGNTLLAVDFHDNVSAWDMESGKETKNEQMGLIETLPVYQKSPRKPAHFQYRDPLTGREMKTPIRVLSPWRGWSLAKDGKHLSLSYWSAEEQRQIENSPQWAPATGGVTDLQAKLEIPTKKWAAISSWESVGVRDLEKFEFIWTKEIAPPYAGGPALKTCRVNGLALSPDRKMVAAATDNGLIELFDVMTGERVAGSRSHPGFFWGPVQFVPGGKLALLTLGKERVLWNLAEGKKVRGFGKDSGEDESILTPDGKSVLVGHYSGNKLRLRLEEILSGQEQWTLKEQLETFPDVQFSADGQTLALYSKWTQQPGVTFVSVKTGEREREFRGSDIRIVRSVAVSPEMTVATEAAGRQRIQLWDPGAKEDDAKELWSWTMPADSLGHLRHVHFVPGGKLVLAAMDGQTSVKESLFVLDAKTGKQLRGIQGSSVDHISPDGRFIAYRAYTPAADGKREYHDVVRDLQSGEVILKLKNCSRGQFSADSKIFASAEGAGTVGGNTPSSIEFYDLSTKQRLGPPRTHPAPIRNMTFAPTGNRLAVQYNDSTVILWEGRPATQ